MCNRISDGGRRCPVHQHRSTAIRRLVRESTGLQEDQIINVFRELRREGSNSADVIDDTHFEMRLGFLRAVVDDDSAAAHGYDRQMAIAEEQSEETTNEVRYAITRLESRSREKAAKLQEAFQELADRSGLTKEEVSEQFNEIYEAQAPSDTSQPEYNTTVRARYERGGLPYDRSTIVALERLRTTLTQPQERRQRITSYSYLNSSQIDRIGYDEGRVEVFFHGADHPYAYQNVPESVFERIRDAQRPGRVYNNALRGNTDYTYDSAEAAAEDAYAVRCRSCGQFRAQRHSCPQRATRANLVATGTPASDVQAALDSGATPDIAAPVIQAGPSRGPLGADATEEQINALIADEEFQTRLPFATADTYQSALGETRHRINLGDTLVGRNTFSGTTNNRAADALTYQFSDRMHPTPDELNWVNEARAAYGTMQGVQTLHFVNQVRNNIRNTDIRMPVATSFRANNRYGGQNHPAGNVTGALTLGRLAEGEVLQHVTVQESELQCTCDVYRRNYSCIHTRTVAAHPFAFLANRTNTFTDSSNSLDAYVNNDDISTALSEEAQIRAEMVRANVSREDAGASMAARLERERVAAETAARERREAASRAERERLEASRTAAQRLQRSNSSTVAANNAYRERMAARWAEADEPVYSNNTAAFYADYRETKRRKRANEDVMDFRTENVTDGICGPEEGGRAFGVELEFDIRSGVNRSTALNNIGRDLHAAGLTTNSYQNGYHSAARSGWANWSFETDVTVAGELVSPIMRDTPEHWEQLRKATEIITRHGGIASTRAGSHVHVSTASYEVSPAKHVELLRQVAKNDEIMYRLSMNPERGTHRGTQWCAPNIADDSSTVAADTMSTHNILGRHQHHGQGMNYESTYNSDYSRSNVEFRMWDATLDPAVIQRQVMISAAMTDYAERQVIENGESRPVENRPRIGTLRNQERTALGSRTTHTEETFAQTMGNAPEFIDSLFRRQEDRKRITDLFAVTNWLPASGS